MLLQRGRLPLYLFTFALIFISGSAFADLVRTGENPVSGSGLGAVQTVLTVTGGGNESGCVSWNGSVDVIGSNCPPGHPAITGGDEQAAQSQSRTLAETGIDDVDNFRVVLNPNENDDDVIVEDIVVRFFSPTGTLLFTSPLAAAERGQMLTGDFGGTGSSGLVLYALDLAQRAQVESLGIFDNPNNRVTVSGTLSDTASGGDTFYVSSFLAGDVGVSKTDSADPILPDTSYSYTITVSNAGPDVVPNVTVTDTLPTQIATATITNAGGGTCTTPTGTPLSFTCTFTNLAVSATAAVITLDVTPVSGLQNVVLTNTVSVTGDISDANTANNTDTETTTIGAPPTVDLSVEKTSTPEPVLVGEQLQYTITVRNLSTTTAAPNVQVVDTLPAGATYGAATPTGGTGGTCGVPSGQTLVCSFTSLAAGGTATITMSITPTAWGSLTNTVTVSSDASDPDMSNNTDSVTNQAVGADLSIAKADSPDPVQVGTTLTYTVTVTNNGDADATNVVVTDTLPAGFTPLTAVISSGSCSPLANPVVCTAPSLAAGNFVTVTITGTPTATGTISNTAVVDANEFDPNTANNTITIDTTVVAPATADLQITKVDSPDPVTLNEQITYTITVTNNGPGPAPGGFTLTDALPANTTFASLSATAGVSCTTPVLGANGPVDCSFTSAFLVGDQATVTLAVTVTSGASVTNTATVAAVGTDDPIDTNDSATAQTAVVEPCFTINDVDVTQATGDIVFTIGLDPATQISTSINFATQDDTAQAGVDYVPASGTLVFAPGDKEKTITVQVLNFSGTGTKRFFLNLSQPPNQAVCISDEQGTGTIILTPPPTVADLQVTKSDSPDPVMLNGQITYTITVTNNGPDAAPEGFTLTDALPSNTTFQSLSAPAGLSCTTPAQGTNGSIDCTFATPFASGATSTLTLVVNATGTPSVSNTVTIEVPGGVDPDMTDNTATAVTAVNQPAPVSADLQVTKADTPDPVAQDGQISYSIVVTNNGPDAAAAGFTLSDPLPANTTFQSLTASAGLVCTSPAQGATGLVSCTFDASFASAATATLTLVVNVTGTPATITNTATVAARGGVDANSANDVASAVTTVTPRAAISADLGITKTDGPDPVSMNGQITYTITVTNLGPDAAPQGFTLADTLPANTTFRSLTAPGITCVTPAQNGSGAITCTFDSAFAANATATLSLVVNVTGTPATITNTATVAARGGVDANSANDTATAVTTVTPPPTSADLRITKTDSPDPVSMSGQITYTITVTNLGPDAAPQGFTLADTLPANTTFRSLTAAGISCVTPAENASGAITCTFDSAFAANATSTLSLVVNVTGTPSVILNTATVTATGGVDPVPTNNTATASTNVTQPAVAAESIPTASEWGLLALALLLGLGAVFVLRPS